MLFCQESEVLQRATADRAYGNEIPTNIRRRPDQSKRSYKSYGKSRFGDVLMSYNRRNSSSSTISSEWLMRRWFLAIFKEGMMRKRQLFNLQTICRHLWRFGKCLMFRIRATTAFSPQSFHSVPTSPLPSPSSVLKVPIPWCERLPRRWSFLQSILQNCCLVASFRRSKLYAVIDCLFLLLLHWSLNQQIITVHLHHKISGFIKVIIISCQCWNNNMDLTAK